MEFYQKTIFIVSELNVRISLSIQNHTEYLYYVYRTLQILNILNPDLASGGKTHEEGATFPVDAVLLNFRVIDRVMYVKQNKINTHLDQFVR